MDSWKLRFKLSRQEYLYFHVPKNQNKLFLKIFLSFQAQEEVLRKLMEQQQQQQMKDLEIILEK